MQIKRRGFTIIELIVAASVLAILSTLVITNFSATRRNTRDARRKEDVQTMLSAVSQYNLSKNTSFISVTQKCTPKTTNSNTSIPQDWYGDGEGCVGAAGLSYGKINAVSGNSFAHGTITSRTYVGSIAQALHNNGFLNTIPTDPLAKKDGTAADSDYYLIRACSTGYQTPALRGSLFSVWAIMENTPTDVDNLNSTRYPGGSGISAALTNGSSVYAYDFAAQEKEYHNSIYLLNGFAAGNGGRVSAAGPVSSDACEQGA